MPPKIKITKENVINTAVNLVRAYGESALNARTIADVLACSTQPIFSNFSTMEALKEAVIEGAEALANEYVKREMESGEYPAYKANGMAYIRFAKEEKELFKLLYMRARKPEIMGEEKEDFLQMVRLLGDSVGLCVDDAKLFHLEMWAYVHGIACMFATGYLELRWELVEKMLTDAYQGLRKTYCLE